MKLVFLISLMIFESHYLLAQQAIGCGENKVYICHKGKNTLCLSESAVQAHLDHGDYLGECNENKCNVSASGGIISCKNSKIILTAISEATGITYNWLGPNNFASSLKAIEINVPGIYTVTITNLTNGCTASDTAIVNQNIIPPELSVNASGTLSCTATAISLYAFSTTPNTNLVWTGFNSGQNPVIVYNPDKYYITATNNTNGCIKTDSISVINNNASPGAVTLVNEKLSCKTNSVRLLGSSNTSGVTYSWIGPNSFKSTEQNPITTLPGIYTLIVTNPLNGCSSSSATIVEQDTTIPRDVNAFVSDLLSCKVKTVNISGSSTTGGISYNWKGPDGFTSTNQNIMVSTPGNYILQVRKLINGCVVIAGASVIQDTITPKGVTAGASAILSCSDLSIMLIGSSSTNQVSYNWSGPARFKTSLQNPIVSLAGMYVLTVVNSVNECYTNKSVTVEQNTTPPSTILANSSGSLDCNNNYFTLTGSSTTANAEYLWTSPENTVDPNKISYAVTPGVYVLRVTDPNNGCSDTSSIQVVLDTSPPASKIIEPDSQPEALTICELTAQLVNDVQYSWFLSSINPNWTIQSGVNTPSLTYYAGDSGTNATFALSVKSNSNGCFNQSQIVLKAEP